MTDKPDLAPESVENFRRDLLTVDRLPTISTMFGRILTLIEDEKTSIRDVEKIIRLDQVISTRILKLINSPFYGFRDVTSISHAISLLGFNNLKNLVLSASLSNVFDVEQPISELSVSDFWLHSIGVAYVSKLLSLHTGIGDSDELFTLGLLHDIGKVMYLNVTPVFFQALIDEARERDISLNSLEGEVGLSHTHLGWYLTSKWNFPAKICTVIKNHHNIDGANEYTDETAIVNLADFLTLRMKLGRSGNLFPDPPDTSVAGRLKLSKKIWEQIKHNLQDQRDAVIKLAQELLKTEL